VEGRRRAAAGRLGRRAGRRRDRRPLFGGLPLDPRGGEGGRARGAGRVRAQRVGAAGDAGRRVAFGVRGGILNGYDLGAVQAASALPDLAEAEAALRRALNNGATEFERLEGTARFADGRATLETLRSPAEGGAVATVAGTVDPARGGAALDLRIATRPVAEAPEIGLRIAGPAAEPAAVAGRGAVPALAGGERGMRRAARRARSTGRRAGRVAAWGGGARREAATSLPRREVSAGSVAARVARTACVAMLVPVRGHRTEDGQEVDLGLSDGRARPPGPRPRVRAVRGGAARGGHRPAEALPLGRGARPRRRGLHGHDGPARPRRAGPLLPEAALVVEEVAKGCAASARDRGRTQQGAVLGRHGLRHGGAAALGGGLVLAGDKPAICITETGAGSDAAAMGRAPTGAAAALRAQRPQALDHRGRGVAAAPGLRARLRRGRRELGHRRLPRGARRRRRRRACAWSGASHHGAARDAGRANWSSRTWRCRRRWCPGPPSGFRRGFAT
jgi:hypothetical protein